MSDLKVWKGDEDWIVAETPQEALELLAKHGGWSSAEEWLEDHGVASAEEEFDALRDSHSLTIDCEDEKVTKTCAEWCAENGKGYLAGTNW